MYQVKRDDKRVMIYDWRDQLIYSADKQTLILYDGITGIRTDEVGKLTDDQLLIALATAVKLAL